MILHTHVTGEGEPIVLIHSGGMTGSTEYEQQSEFFSSRNYQVIRPDLRGHGKSDGDIDDYFNRCAADLNNTLVALDIDSCHIAGVSLGGLTALMFAKQYPGMVKSLTFSGIFPVKPDNWEELVRQEAEGHEKLFNDEEATKFLDEIHGNNDWKAILKSFDELNFYPFHETGNVSNLKVPLLCMVGGTAEQEYFAALSFKQLNPAIQISIIPFAGHLVHRDQPELYTQTLNAFFGDLNNL